MISGRIVKNNEPVRYKADSSTYQNNFMGFGMDDESEWNKHWIRRRALNSGRLNEQMLLSVINKATCDGYIVGSRVGRASGNPGIGTIIEIHRDFRKAYDEDNVEFTPFRVKWDTSPMFVGGEFDYGIDDLRLISSPQLPSLESPHENVSNLPLAC